MPYPMSLQLSRFFLSFFVFFHACENNVNIPFLFVLDLSINDIYLLEHQIGETGIALLFPLVAEARHFYHAILECFFPLVLPLLRLPVQ